MAMKISNVRAECERELSTNAEYLRKFWSNFPYNPISHYACCISVGDPLSRHQKTTKKTNSLTEVVFTVSVSIFF